MKNLKIEKFPIHFCLVYIQNRHYYDFIINRCWIKKITSEFYYCFCNINLLILQMSPHDNNTFLRSTSIKNLYLGKL
jgi:hypothetical protein